MAEILVVTSRVKDVLKAKNLRTSAEFIETLSTKVAALIDAAAAKAVEAKRATVRSEDL